MLDIIGIISMVVLVILLASQAGSSFKISSIKKISIFLVFLFIFGIAFFKAELNRSEVISETKNKYCLNLVKEIKFDSFDSENDFSNIYVYKHVNKIASEKTEYFFWVTDTNENEIFFRGQNVIVTEIGDDSIPSVIEHIYEYDYVYERTNFLKFLGGSEEPIPNRITYELLVPKESIYEFK